MSDWCPYTLPRARGSSLSVPRHGILPPTVPLNPVGNRLYHTAQPCGTTLPRNGVPSRPQSAHVRPPLDSSTTPRRPMSATARPMLLPHPPARKTPPQPELVAFSVMPMVPVVESPNAAITFVHSDAPDKSPDTPEKCKGPPATVSSHEVTSGPIDGPPKGQVALKVTGGDISSRLRSLRDVGAAAVAATRLQKILPWATLEHLHEKGINTNRLDRILDRFLRFVLLVRGRLMKRALRRARPQQNPFIEWDEFVKGSSEAISSHYCANGVTVNGTASITRLVEFTPSHIRFRGWGDNKNEVTEFAISLITSIECSEKTLQHLHVTIRSSGREILIEFEVEDSPPVLSMLVARASRRFFLGTTIINGLMRKSVRIVHFNDVYHLNCFKNPDGTGIVGGASRFLTRLREIQMYHNPLILFSGDFMSPSLMSVMMRGRHMIDAFNLIGVHFGTFGNHEFDYGMQSLKDCIDGQTKGSFVFTGSNTQWIMSNMRGADGKPLGGVVSRAMVTWNSVQVGILGLSENWLPSCAQLKRSEWQYEDVFETGERMAQDLRRDGAEVVVALTHSRFATDVDMSRLCPSIDLILGGHDHFYKNAPKYRVIKSGEEFEFLTEVDVIIDRSRGARYRSTVHPITRNIEPHLGMEALIARYDDRLQQRMGKIIGTNSVPLDLTEACCRFREGLAPGFIVDVMASRAHADFAVLGGAAIAGKNIKPPGDITVGDIFNWFPNDTRIMTVRLPGSTVVKLLNVMVREVPNEAPSFPHPSAALTFTINTMRSPTVVEGVCVAGAPIVPTKQYVVAVEDFVGLGKAKYKFIPTEGELLCDEESAEQITYWIIEYFEGEGPRALSADKKLSMLTNTLQMREKLGKFSMSHIQSLRKHSSQDLSTSLSTNPASRDTVEKVAKSFTPATGVLMELMRCSLEMAKMQDAQIETIYFAMEVAMASLVPCEQTRILHLSHDTGTAWYRSDANRRVSVPKKGVFCCCQEFDTIVSSEHDGMESFNASVEGVEITKNFVALPITHRGTVMAVAVLCNAGRGRFLREDISVLSLFILQSVAVVAHATAKLRHEEEERLKLHLIAAAAELVQTTEDTTLNDKLAKITKHCKKIFNVEKAYMYIHDVGCDDVWTVRRSINANKVIEDAVLRRPLKETPVIQSILKVRHIRKVDAAAVDGERLFERSGLLSPVFEKGKRDPIGVLLLADKLIGDFTETDQHLLNLFTPFVAIAVQTSNELEVLKTGVDRRKLRTLPVHELNRIRFKRGWGSVRSRLHYIASAMYKEKESLLAENAESLS